MTGNYFEKAMSLLDLPHDLDGYVLDLKKKNELLAKKIDSSEIMLCGLSDPAKRLIDSGFLDGRIIGIYDTISNASSYKNIPVARFGKMKDEPPSPHHLYIIMTSVFLGDYVRVLREIGAEGILSYHMLTILCPDLDVFAPRYDLATTTLQMRSIVGDKEYSKQMLLNLGDDESKRIFGGMICYLLDNDLDAAVGIKSKNSVYFDPGLMDVKNGAVVVDGGGFNGDTLEEFLALADDFSAYHLFEPDESLLKHVKRRVSDCRVLFHAKALYDKPACLRFKTDSTGMGRFAEDGEITVPCVSLDEAVAEKISHIKLDVEGAELSALAGATKQIERNKPYLAISVYHKADDIPVLSQFVKSHVPAYRFYFRCSFNSFFNDLILICTTQ